MISVLMKSSPAEHWDTIVPRIISVSLLRRKTSEIRLSKFLRLDATNNVRRRKVIYPERACVRTRVHSGVDGAAMNVPRISMSRAAQDNDIVTGWSDENALRRCQAHWLETIQPVDRSAQRDGLQ
jgi:hypothetical protein